MRRFIVFGTVCLGLLLSSITTYASSVAISTIIKDLNTDIILAGWVLSVYSLMYTVISPLAGRITEMLGRKSTFIEYTLLFITGSILCALAPNVYFLIGARALQALGGGGFMPCAAGIVADEFPEARERYIGLFGSILPIGMVIGPNVGALFTQAWGWRSIYWLNLPLGLIVLVLSILLLPAKQKKNVRTSIDFIGSGLLFGTVFTFMVGLSVVGSYHEIPWLIVIVLWLLSIGMFIPFLRWEHREKSPIIDVELLSSRPFLAANIYNILYGVTGLGILSLIPLFGVNVYKMSVLESGIMLTPRSIGLLVASGITSFFLMRWGYLKPILVGTIILAFGFLLLAFETPGSSVMGINIGATVVLFGVIGLCGIGPGVSGPAANNSCIELMPDKVATITGLRGMFRSLGSTMGVSLATVILNMVEDVQRAWFIVLIASVVITLISVPSIFGMPAPPTSRIVAEK